jgi:hypothetical protein
VTHPDAPAHCPVHFFDPRSSASIRGRLLLLRSDHARLRCDHGDYARSRDLVYPPVNAHPPYPLPRSSPKNIDVVDSTPGLISASFAFIFRAEISAYYYSVNIWNISQELAASS